MSHLKKLQETLFHLEKPTVEKISKHVGLLKVAVKQNDRKNIIDNLYKIAAISIGIILVYEEKN